MLKRLMIVSLAFCIWMASAESRAADTLELSNDNVVSIWNNINEIILVLSANIALDDEWIEELRDLHPSDEATNVQSEMATFEKKLNALLASSGMRVVRGQASLQDATATSALYMASGTLLDNLIYYLINSDSLASVAIYYGGEAAHNQSDNDVVAQISLANQRLDAFIEENGL